MNTAFDLNHNLHEGILQPYITDPFSQGSGRSSMLSVTVQKLTDVSILHCRGRILFGDTNLYNAALSQKDSSILVLDLAQVDGIDAGGLGVLLDVRAWALANGSELKLLNVMASVQQVLESTRLDLIFAVCSVREMFHLLCRALGIDAPLGRRTDQANPPDRELNGGDQLQQTRN